MSFSIYISYIRGSSDQKETIVVGAAMMRCYEKAASIPTLLALQSDPSARTESRIAQLQDLFDIRQNRYVLCIIY
jgi:hypothetical protein